jgi:hypothetical protein
MKLQEIIDLLEILDGDDERRMHLERQLTPIMERIGDLPVTPKTQERDRKLACEHRGEETTTEKTCCGGTKRKVAAWTCAKTGSTVTMSDCLKCAEYVSAKRQEIPARKSCIECVEKHLGAAAVLLSEAQSGYPEHRLLAIGHLHEAEDESREWPGLHTAIRDARKKYQAEGVIPDLSDLSEKIRPAAMEKTDAK